MGIILSNFLLKIISFNHYLLKKKKKNSTLPVGPKEMTYAVTESSAWFLRTCLISPSLLSPRVPFYRPLYSLLSLAFQVWIFQSHNILYRERDGRRVAIARWIPISSDGWGTSDALFVPSVCVAADCCSHHCRAWSVQVWPMGPSR